MRQLTLEVPVQVIVEIADKLAELELENTIIGTTADNNIEILVDFDKTENKKVDCLEEFLQNLIDDMESEP